MAEMLQATSELIKKLGVDEVERFQRAFPDSKGADFMDVILRKEGDFWAGILTNMDSSDIRVRQAQGGREAISRVVTIIGELLKFKAPEQVEEEDIVEEEKEDAEHNVIY